MRDVIKKDIKAISVSEDRWYDETSISWMRWKTTYKKGLESLSIANDHQVQEHSNNHIKCDESKRSFRKESDKKRHKCISERQKPVSEQRGAVQCATCHRCFRSHGGLSTVVDLTKQMKLSFTLPPLREVGWPCNGSKTEGRKVCVNLCVHVRVCMCVYEGDKSGGIA